MQRSNFQPMKKFKLYHLVLIIIFIPLISYAQWEWLNPLPNNNSFKSCYFVNNDVGYISGELGIILKTSDGGITWSQLSIGTANSLFSIYFPKTETGYAVGSQGTILKTIDPNVAFSIFV